MAQETMSFQAEVKQLLNLMIHSLYSNKEIFLRELISNASDAADKLRFEAIENSALYENDSDLRIRVSYDKTARTVTIDDNGIGMSRDEAISHLGTIARSGTKEFFSKLSGDQQKDAALIGQFGVGFYSGFIVADKITVETRRAGLPASEGVRWTSAGEGDFAVEQIERAQRGTTITLHLRADEDELLSTHKLKSIIQKYSDHVALPILMKKEEWDAEKSEMVTKDEDETVNQASALWTRPKSEITDEQYKQFYQHLVARSRRSARVDAQPRRRPQRVHATAVHAETRAVRPLEPRSSQRPEAVRQARVHHGRRRAIAAAVSALRKGVVDSADLPLNVSREILQESRDVKAIREGVTKRVLSMLEEIASSSRKPRGRKGEIRDLLDRVRPGVQGRPRRRLRQSRTHRQAGALRLDANATAEQNVSLADYVARMKPEQTKIYYVTADSWQAAKNSPHLEVFRKKGVEVLLLSDRVDEWALSFLNEFDGKPLQSVARGDLDLGALNDEEKEQQEKVGEEMKPLVEKMKEALEGKAKDVRLTFRLTDSPTCLVADEGDMSGYLQRMLKAAGQQAPQMQPILEVNPEHPLVKNLNADSANFSDWCHLLFDQALLAEGGALEDPASFVKRTNTLLLAR